jgi:hypothetical protein
MGVDLITRSRSSLRERMRIDHNLYLAPGTSANTCRTMPAIQNVQRTREMKIKTGVAQTGLACRWSFMSQHIDFPFHKTTHRQTRVPTHRSASSQLQKSKGKPNLFWKMYPFSPCLIHVQGTVPTYRAPRVLCFHKSGKLCILLFYP